MSQMCAQITRFGGSQFGMFRVVRASFAWNG